MLLACLYFYLLFIFFRKLVIRIRAYLKIRKIYEQILFFSVSRNQLFSLDNETKEKFQNFLKDKQINEIQEIIILENKNIITIENDSKISYYEKDKLNYKKFFNNLNKYYFIYGLCHLQFNRFCFISYFDKEHIHFCCYNNDDFTKKEIEIKMDKPFCKFKNKTIFSISYDKVIIISKYEFYIFNTNVLEIEAIYDVGLICCILPFNVKKNLTNCNFEYFSIVFWEKNNLYMKIYHVDSDSGYYIQDSDRIDLYKYSN
jgi:hypothetical protein